MTASSNTERLANCTSRMAASSIPTASNTLFLPGGRAPTLKASR